jgi:hypothetical protein
VQTYDNGEVVAWDQPPAADGSEPERPAPTVALSPPAAGGADVATSTTGGTTTTAVAVGTDTTARWLGGAGLLVGALGLGVGAGAVFRNRRTAGAGR